MDGPFLVDTFTPCEEAARIARFLITQDPARPFTFVGQARIAYVLQQPALYLKGEPCDAYIATAHVQGSNRLLWEFLAASFGQPDRFPLEFLVYLDKAAWDRRGWSDEVGRSGAPLLREALIYHELSHLRHQTTADGEPRYHEDGRELLALRSHTYEFFDHEIRRYGPVTLALDQVGLDYVHGAKEEKARRRRGKLRIA